MDAIESELKTFCFSAPRWMQLELQGFWYGLLSTVLTYKEEGLTVPPINTAFIETILLHADPEFTDWPTLWLESIAAQFLALNLSIDDLNGWFERLEQAFRDSVPTDLNIFTTYSNGETLTPDQWSRLYDAIAFMPSPVQSKRNAYNKRTRHIHGRRALTPLRSRKAITRKHHTHYTFVKLQ